MDELNKVNEGTTEPAQDAPATPANAQQLSAPWYVKFGRVVYTGFVRFKHGKVTRWVYKGGKWILIGMGINEVYKHGFANGVKSVPVPEPVVAELPAAEETAPIEEPTEPVEETNDDQIKEQV